MNDTSIISIPLTLGQFTIVFRVDYDKYRLDLYTWHAKWSDHTQTFYAATNRKISHDPNLPKYIRLHQLIMESFGTKVDHADGDSLNNLRTNLRIATNAQNMHNRRVSKNNKLGFKGVYEKGHCITGEPTGRYAATLRVDGRMEHVGYFGSPEEAARAYDRRAIEVRGEFARTNFPRSNYA